MQSQVLCRYRGYLHHSLAINRVGVAAPNTRIVFVAKSLVGLSVGSGHGQMDDKLRVTLRTFSHSTNHDVGVSARCGQYWHSLVCASQCRVENISECKKCTGCSQCLALLWTRKELILRREYVLYQNYKTCVLDFGGPKACTLTNDVSVQPYPYQKL